MGTLRTVNRAVLAVVVLRADVTVVQEMCGVVCGGVVCDGVVGCGVGCGVVEVRVVTCNVDFYPSKTRLTVTPM